jgi:hypothetical protein
VAGVLVLVAIVALVWQTQTRAAFVLQDGQDQLLVLIRNDASGVYQVQYRGRQPVQLQSIKTMLAGQILHVDVREVAVSKESAEVVLEQPAGALPEGHEISLQPGDVFNIRVTLRGQSIGGNYLYGFRIGYQNGGSEQTFELVMDFDYEIIVE